MRRTLTFINRRFTALRRPIALTHKSYSPITILPPPTVQCQARYHQTSGGSGDSSDPKAVSAQARALLKQLPPGCMQLTALNLDVELNKAGSTPTVLYFHSPSNAEVLEYTRIVLNQVGNLNRAAEAMATDPEGAAAGVPKVALRCGLVDCEREWALAQAFQIQPDLFPLFFFVFEGRVIDKMIGVHSEAQVAEAFKQFILWVHQQLGKKTHTAQAELPPQVKQSAASGDSSQKASQSADKPDRADEYDENAMTLQVAGIRKLQSKDYPKAFELFTKARTMAEASVKDLKAKLGVQAKKITPEINEKLRKDANYLALPQAICGQAMTRLGQKNIDEAFAFCQEVRRDFPWAIRDNRQIADTMCRVELIKISGFDIEKDNYISLMKNDELMDEPAEFYSYQLRLAVAHYFERHPELAIEELLKLIRAEARLMPKLMASGVITPPEGASTPQNKTPARRAIFLIFESLGNGSGAVVDARKKLSAFLYA